MELNSMSMPDILKQMKLAYLTVHAVHICEATAHVSQIRMGVAGKLVSLNTLSTERSMVTYEATISTPRSTCSDEIKPLMPCKCKVLTGYLQDGALAKHSFPY